MKRIGLRSANFEENDGAYEGKKKLVRLLVNMIMASNLQGCQGVQQDGWSISWTMTWMVFTIIFLLMVVVCLFLKLQNKAKELRKYQMVWQTVREAARGQDPLSSELDAWVFAEDEEEEKKEDDETMSEGDEEAPMVTPIPGVDRSEEAIMRRHRVVRHEDLHGSAEAGEGNPEEEEESFELEENPNQRYQRYVSSAMEEISDIDEWTEIHYGAVHATEEPGEDEEDSGRSRSRGSGVPEPKAMPKPLAQQSARRVAMETAMDMAEAIDNSGGPHNNTPNIGSIWEVPDAHYFLSSIPMAGVFGIGPVPREPLALDDYRWDQLGAGPGPETVVVRNCNNLSNYIPTVRDMDERRSLQKLLRNLQNLLILFQSGRPELWLEAAQRTSAWLANDRSQHFFDEAETEAGSRESEESEEEDREDDPGQNPDDDDGRDGQDDGADGGAGAGGGGDEHHGQVAASSAAAASSSDTTRVSAAGWLGK
eukprot:s676_g7.t1